MYMYIYVCIHDTCMYVCIYDRVSPLKITRLWPCSHIYMYFMQLNYTQVIKTEGKKAKKPFKGVVITSNQVLGGLKMVTILDKNVVEIYTPVQNLSILLPTFYQENQTPEGPAAGAIRTLKMSSFPARSDFAGA